MSRKEQVWEQAMEAVGALSEVSLPRLQGRRIRVVYRRGKLYLRLVKEPAKIDSGVAGRG